jgi:hypothetical protein
MPRTPNTVLGIYPTRDGVENAVEAFRDAGFRSVDISLVLSEKMSTEDLFPRRASKSVEKVNLDRPDLPSINGPLGWLQEVGPAAIRGEGSYLVAGPIAQTLESVAPDHATEQLAAALGNLGIPQNETYDYADKVMHGGALLSVDCASTEDAVTARHLHADLGGTDVFSTWPITGETSASNHFENHWG